MLIDRLNLTDKQKWILEEKGRIAIEHSDMTIYISLLGEQEINIRLVDNEFNY